MEALLAMDDRHMDEHLNGLMGSPHSRMGHALEGRCREVAVSGFRSLSADAGADGQKTTNGEELEDCLDLELEFEGGGADRRQQDNLSRQAVDSSRSQVKARPAQQRPQPQHRRNRSIGVPSEAAPFSNSGHGYFPRHVANDVLPRQQYSPQCTPRGASATEGPVRVLSPREVRAKELGLIPDTVQNTAPGGYSVRADSSPHRLASGCGRLKGAAQGPPAVDVLMSPLSALSPSDSEAVAACQPSTREADINALATIALPQDKSPVRARKQSPCMAQQREAQKGQDTSPFALDEAESDPSEDTNSQGGRLPLSARRGAVVPKLSTPPGSARSSPRRGTPSRQDLAPNSTKEAGAADVAPASADLEPLPLKVGPGIRAAFQRCDQRSPSRPNCPLPSAPKAGGSSSRQNSPWRSPKVPSPGGPSPLSSGGTTSVQDSSHISRLTAGSPGSGEMLSLRTPLRAPLGPQSLQSSPVSSPARRRAHLPTGGAFVSGFPGGAGLSAFQLDLLATTAANPVASSPRGAAKGYGGVGHRRTSSYSVESPVVMSVGVPVGAASRAGHRRSPSFEGGVMGAYQGLPPNSKLMSVGSVGADTVLLSNRSMSPVNAPRSASGAGVLYTGGLSSSSRSRFGLAADTGGETVGKGQGKQPQQQEEENSQGTMLRRTQHANALESAAFHAKRAAIRKGVRDLHQAQRQRMHRRGASFAAQDGGGSLDLGSLNLDEELDVCEVVMQGPHLAAAKSVKDTEDDVTMHGRGAKGPRSPLQAQRVRPAQSKYRHSWGNEPDFLKTNALCQDSIPGEGLGRDGGAGVELMAEYSFKRGLDLAKVLQQKPLQLGGKGGSDSEWSQQLQASHGAGAIPRPRHKPRHSMDLGKEYSMETQEGPQGPGEDVVRRKGSAKAAKDTSGGVSTSGGCPMPSPKQVLSGMTGRVGLTPRDHVLGLPYDDVTRLYAMHRKDLGAGQFGVVRKCKEIATGQVFACKSIRKESIRCQEDADDIRKEVACMRLLQKHPRFLNLHAAVEDKNHVHLVMDLCDGGDLLDSITEKGPLPEARAARMAMMLVEALLHCHCLGIVHRDVKPENILLVSPSADTDMKLVDFGVSTFAKPGEKLKEIIGTPEYMAPEMLQQSYGPEADIWSAGVVLYVVLTSVPPFWASDRQSLMESILSKEVRFKASRWSGISEECKDLVFRMLTKDPAKRIKATDVLRHPWIVRHCGV